jgi:pimeloyl-ACP methyl ester carboxylesterase
MLVVSGMMPPAVTQGFINVSGAGLDKALAKSGPMLVTYGAKDLLFQPTMSTRMQALNQEAQISLYPESGHAPFYDEPDRFNRELAAFHQRPT